MTSDTPFLRARRCLILDHPFMGSLVMHLEPVEDRSTKTLWVDGKSIGYNPDSFDELSLRDGAGLIAKGVLHCALGHHVRRNARTQKTWQEACDLVTNGHIISSGLTLPFGNTQDTQYIEQNLAAEQVYLLLKQMEEDEQKQDGGDQGQQGDGSGQGSGQGTPSGQPGSGPSQGPGSPDVDVRDLPGNEPGQAPTETEQNQQQQDWKINLQQAVQNATQRGDLPASLERAVAQAQAPAVDWKQELRRYMTSTCREDLSWSKPNRRFIAAGLYLPAAHSERMNTVVIHIDTSGSITDRILGAFEGAVNEILEDVKPQKTIVVYCDARVNLVEEFAAEDYPIKLQAVGGGGTNFKPVYAYLADNDIVPDCLVSLTDTYGTFPDQEPEFPVLWASTAGEEVPFGDLIKIDISQDPAIL
jgi:predicted metal-dependent peptidase